MNSFYRILAAHDLSLVREKTNTLQVNVGLICNQACKHCHLDAGPGRKEIMDSETVDQVITYAAGNEFQVIDITGGAPELNPNIMQLVEGVCPHAAQIMFRANLTALMTDEHEDILRQLEDKKVRIVASFPSINKSQSESQRGKDVFDNSVSMLRKLNEIGYGKEGSGLGLDLVSNPAGAFLPPDQSKVEKKFKAQLLSKWGVEFNNLFTFSNVPLGRFRRWLEASGNLEGYLEKLSKSFNPCTVENLMCRNLVSVGWDGYLYDCDFNLAASLPMGGQKTHITEMSGPPEPGSPISVSDHCFSCTAGAGFT